MKFFCFVLIIIPSFVFGQKLNISIETGYGFRLSPNYMVDGTITAKEESYINDNIIYSFGQGVNYGAGITYSVHEHVSIGVLASFLSGKNIDKVNYGLNGFSHQVITSANMFRIVPQVKLNYPLGKNKLFARVGIIIGVKGELLETRIRPEYGHYSETTYSGGLSYGILNSIGYNIKIADKISFSIELRSYSHSFGPTRSDIITFLTNDKSTIDELSNSVKHVKYKDNFEKKNGIIDETIPSVRLRRFYPFSSVGLNISFVYSI